MSVQITSVQNVEDDGRGFVYQTLLDGAAAVRRQRPRRHGPAVQDQGMAVQVDPGLTPG